MLALMLALMLGQATTPAPPPQGAIEPQQTSPLPGATPATPTVPPANVPPPPGQSVVSPPTLGRVFASDHGLIFNAIRPDKVMDFEIVIDKLRMALANSTDPVRRQQAMGWKIYKAIQPGPNGSVLYVFVMDPAVRGADYGVAKILAEAYPAEIMELYRMYTTAFSTAGQTLVNLQVVTPPVAGVTGLRGPGTEGTTTPIGPVSPAVPAPSVPTPQVP
jgi:hypothetical protein